MLMLMLMQRDLGEMAVLLINLEEHILVDPKSLKSLCAAWNQEQTENRYQSMSVDSISYLFWAYSCPIRPISLCNQLLIERDRSFDLILAVIAREKLDNNDLFG